MPNAQRKIATETNPANYTGDELKAYLAYQETGKSTQVKYFGQPVGETNFTEEDRIKIREARKAHRLAFQSPSRKQEVIAAIRRKDHVITGHRVNVLGNKKVVRITDTSIEVPKKAKLTLVKPLKVKTAKADGAKTEAVATAPAVATTA